MRAAIDRDLCVGHGLCYMLAPDVFQDDDEGYGQVTADGPIAADRVQDARRAAGSCPERAITLTLSAAERTADATGG
ncbi:MULTISPECIES: ferredoxin [Frankia]|uniref:Ferredoxin n=1 Tax=Frankia alni (strain DSM 45986 / CECT 9034 / ACN14a) TaxID=326424 RepID=Q0RKF0_FRAAA|nr:MULTISPECIES: ferredoxin [Frankia]CAJ62008.1 Putative ferredoxin [Frankia alni ACN14a]